MSTLEDKIMGEKLQYYCSSSEDEGNDDEDEGDEAKQGAAKGAPEPSVDLTQDMTHWSGNSANTGPKGMKAYLCI